MTVGYDKFEGITLIEEPVKPNAVYADADFILGNHTGVFFKDSLRPFLL